MALCSDVPRYFRRWRKGTVSSGRIGGAPARVSSNTEADWRANRDRLGFPGFKSHGFRKTVATVLDQAGLSTREIAEFLGHENPSLTQDVYMSRTAGTVRAAAALDSLLARATAA
ncbi:MULTISPECIES: tyrosine-type recombinase/integrase [unclassified Curtobacterium]|jgi:integrase|uniref:tyrosine-type recombinase/integrase n=1 Tax=unclassified Curtobacterium TaxID=257496 RepID=UPI0009F18BE7|nr:MULTISPECIES: tyrosine-type recombinase/integrase [unclassified Curtobacterium]MCT9622247.1 tyrosine-type recombinase/integrase [Curtobacterium sp. C2H10]